MKPEELAAMREEYDGLSHVKWDRDTRVEHEDVIRSYHDFVPALLAEVERLQKWIESADHFGWIKDGYYYELVEDGGCWTLSKFGESQDVWMGPGGKWGRIPSKCESPDALWEALEKAGCLPE